jgi:hypothetical protein
MEILRQHHQEIVVGRMPSLMQDKLIPLLSSVILLSIPVAIRLTSGIPIATGIEMGSTN